MQCIEGIGRYVRHVCFKGLREERERAERGTDSKHTEDRHSWDRIRVRRERERRLSFLLFVTDGANQQRM